MRENKQERLLATDAAPQPHEIVLATLDECLRVGNLRWRWIELQRERAAQLGTNTSYRTWLARTSDWLNPERRHYLPPHAITDAIEVIGSAEILDPWLALESRVMRERRRSEPQHEPTRTRARR